ncbi:hypothetical protein MAR_034331 [Mya arenaria]|uniref:Uncharacterized protein n=1 Tax=Mya arenaria TaxID=6604 RepID=A0ABY7GE38_MYAAR|nr:hypothetical protein MAR_034331 [Mya arenaria]
MNETVVMEFRPTPARTDNGSRILAVVQSVADDPEDMGTEFIQMEKEQRLLINKLRKFCSTNVLQNASYNGKGSYKFYRSRANNIGYCNVPKTGSSFWIRTLSVLDNGITAAMQILKKSRNRVETELPGVIETVFSTVKKLVKNNCLNWTDLARRTWSAFQSQGYIANEHAPYDVISTILRQTRPCSDGNAHGCIRRFRGLPSNTCKTRKWIANSAGSSKHR